MILETIT